MKTPVSLVLGCSILLNGCLVGPDYKRPAIAAPPSFRGQDRPEPSSWADQAWWDVYSDPYLVALIKEALTNNYDLKTAIARARQALDYLRVARSDYFPTVNLETGAQRDHGVYKNDPDLRLPTNTQTTNLYLGGFLTTWEIDLWGRIRRSNEAANAAYLSTEEARRDLMLLLISQVAQAYLELVELDRREGCLLYTSPSPRDRQKSRMPSSA